MLGFSCWFCGQSIDREDASAVVLTVENLWKWDTGEPLEEEDPQQSVYSHTACAKDRLKGATMGLDPSTFLEDDEE